MKGLLIAGMVLMIVAVLVAGPLVLIWATNTLFSLGIPVTPRTWLAMLILWVFVSTPAYRSKSS